MSWAPYKSKSAWYGRRIRTTTEITRDHVVIPSGTYMTIEKGGSGRFYLIGDKCECCGIRPRISVKVHGRKPPEIELAYPGED